MGHVPSLINNSELDVDRLSVEHGVDLLVCPAEDLLIEVPEINYEQNADYSAKQLNGLFAEITHLAFLLFELFFVPNSSIIRSLGVCIGISLSCGVCRNDPTVPQAR